MKKSVIKIVCFVLIFILLFGGFHKIFNFKQGDGIYSLKVFYEQPDNSIDVMFFGSSHVFENVNTQTLWEEYGIAAYNLCGSVQPFWNTYYYMKEALKTQQPKLMVVDVYGAIQTEDYIDHSRIIKNNFGLKPSTDKLNSVMISSPKEEWPDYILEYPAYHSRYSEITYSDFLEYCGNKLFENWKGFGLNTGTTPYTEPDFYTTESGALTEKCEQYLLEIINLAKKNNIPLLLIKSPYILNKSQQAIYNRVAEIADENGVPFINFNLLYGELELDFSTDYADTSHLNHLGNVKYTRYLANYLKNNYEIPDRRGDKAYHSYDLMAAYYRQLVYNHELKEIQDIGTYVDKLQNDDYTVIYSIAGDYKNMGNYDAVRNELSTIGINLDEFDTNAVWVRENSEIVFSSSSEAAFNWHKDLGEYNRCMVSFSNEAESGIEVNYNNTIYEVSAGLNIFVYDNRTESFVENIRFPLSNKKLVYAKSEK